MGLDCSHTPLAAATQLTGSVMIAGSLSSHSREMKAWTTTDGTGVTKDIAKRRIRGLLSSSGYSEYRV